MNAWLVILSLSLPQVTVRREPYQGWGEAVLIEAARPQATLVVQPELGGRLISYGLGGQNLLFENPDYLGKTLGTAAPGTLDQGYIGYNLDLGPETRGLPKHPALWVGKYTVASEGPLVTLTSGIDPVTRMELTKQVEMDPIDGSLRLLQSMTNRGEKDASYCLWDRTLCAGGGYALVPLNPSSRRPSGWCLLRNGQYAAENPSHPGVRVLGGVLVAKAEGPSSKLGADSDAGWIAYAKGKQLLVKYYRYVPNGVYSDGGNSVELYFDPKVCELEPLSPEVTLTPGRAYEFMERWLILPLEREATTWEEARDLVNKIPAHPFKRK
ncbi:MAG TPA: DUF4380 domain-containing protein [Planctomycetota bacterium]|nr:DUF4380 domain-containing protein [Planctomycetota bacterium]